MGSIIFIMLFVCLVITSVAVAKTTKNPWWGTVVFFGFLTIFFLSCFVLLEMHDMVRTIMIVK